MIRERTAGKKFPAGGKKIPREQVGTQKRHRRWKEVTKKPRKDAHRKVRTKRSNLEEKSQLRKKESPVTWKKKGIKTLSCLPPGESLEHHESARRGFVKKPQTNGPGGGGPMEP